MYSESLLVDDVAGEFVEAFVDDEMEVEPDVLIIVGDGFTANFLVIELLPNVTILLSETVVSRPVMLEMLLLVSGSLINSKLS